MNVDVKVCGEYDLRHENLKELVYSSYFSGNNLCLCIDSSLPHSIMNNNANHCKTNIINMSEYGNISKVKILNRLLRYSENLIIAAHSEGTHLNLGDVILCSENVSENRCRKYIHDKTIINIRNVEADNYYILTCNGICANEEVYNEKNTIITQLLKKSNKYIVSSYMPIYVYGELVSLIYELVNIDLSPIIITYILNDICGYVNGVFPFVCLYTGNINNIVDEGIIDKSILIAEKKDSYPLEKNSFYIIKLPVKAEMVIIDCNSAENTIFNRSQNNLYCISSEHINISITIAEMSFIKDIDDMVNIMQCISKYVLYYDDTNKVLDTSNKIIKMLIDFKQSITKIKKKGICLLNEWNDINKKFKSYQKIYEQYIKYIITNDAYYDEFEKNMCSTVLSRKCTTTKLRCIRCNTTLNLYKVINENISCLYCTVCGIHSISIHNDNTILHKFRYMKNAIDIEIKNINNTTHGDVYIGIIINDKKHGEIFYNSFFKIKEKDFSITIDASFLEDDVHSYKVFVISNLYITYLHGKLIVNRQKE